MVFDGNEMEIRQKVFTKKVLEKLYPAPIEAESDSSEGAQPVININQSLKIYTVAAPPPHINLAELAHSAEQLLEKDQQQNSSSESESDHEENLIARKRRRYHGKRLSQKVQLQDGQQPKPLLSTTQPQKLTKNQKRKLKKKRSKCRQPQDNKTASFVYNGSSSQQFSSVQT